MFRAHFSERVTDGGRLSPQFYTKFLFCLFLSIVRVRPGSPELSEPYCPPERRSKSNVGGRIESVFLALFAVCPCQGFVAPFMIFSSSLSNAHQHCVFFSLPQCRSHFLFATVVRKSPRRVDGASFDEMF